MQQKKSYNFKNDQKLVYLGGLSEQNHVCLGLHTLFALFHKW